LKRITKKVAVSGGASQRMADERETPTPKCNAKKGQDGGQYVVTLGAFMVDGTFDARGAPRKKNPPGESTKRTRTKRNHHACPHSGALNVRRERSHHLEQGEGMCWGNWALPTEAQRTKT